MVKVTFQGIFSKQRPRKFTISYVVIQRGHYKNSIKNPTNLFTDLHSDFQS